MRTAVGQLAWDFLTAIVFLIAYGLSSDLYLATAAAVAAGVAQFAAIRLQGRAVDSMQWLALGLVFVLGLATLITQDSRFIMVKPSIVHAAIGAVMLRPGWMIRYLPPIARDNLPERVMVASGYAWAGLMIGLAALNLVIAMAFEFHIWAWFISVGAVGAKVVAFFVQYTVFRTIIRRKLRLAPAQG